jgi:hypothetical protein
MIIVRNERLIKRNKRIGNISGLLSIIVLGLGMYISFQYQELIYYSLLALVVGFTLSQVGIFYTNRFVKSPRPDQDLDAALKGLDDQYALYHYQSPVAHLLVGPAGIWVLYPYAQKGKITFDERKGRWKKVGGNFYLRFFGQDSIGRPDREIQHSRRILHKELKKIPEFEIPEIRAALVFSNENAEVEADNAPFPTLHARQLKKLIRKETRGVASLPIHIVKTVQDHFGLESIT